ncbi:PBSX family phage terminase large subunit [Ruminococcus sp. Marseille-P6503]|uniref:PBSX family phage terminase large subunit n=1 Tax=Ruminococcus sp. Marseille-P6503 TaxID=2364796 RepID=UPI000F53EBFA|nr:PBSX family phage terminase large subunit [Ruminococcus sp. Marseille-P6503]
MTFTRLSEKQKLLLKWCHVPSMRSRYSAVICDGAVRSGKTVVMITSYILWAMKNFNGANFAICGKTVQSAERNIINPLGQIADITRYFRLSYTRSSHLLTVEVGGKRNYFYIFGGRDESSAALIQGLTLSGIMLDEVALMPRSFVEQAVARTLSVSNARLWFNCNPENPHHYFYTEWILKASEKNALRLHFLMNDNPILTAEDIAKAENMYSGVFYDRFIKGLWVMAEGLVYPEQAQGEGIVPTEDRGYTSYYISVDYGTLNPFSAGLWGKCGGVWYRVREFYYNGREKDVLLTDEEYYSQLERLAAGLSIRAVIVDPSAASFIECIRRHGRFSVIKARNEVTDGIRRTAEAFRTGDIKINDCCQSAINEFAAYRWDDRSADDKPIKEYDHAMDDIRYFVNTIKTTKARAGSKSALGIY